ncbi:hypothetical protein D3C80_1230170 [compost metagenome]
MSESILRLSWISGDFRMLDKVVLPFTLPLILSPVVFIKGFMVVRLKSLKPTRIMSSGALESVPSSVRNCFPLLSSKLLISVFPSWKLILTCSSIFHSSLYTIKMDGRILILAVVSFENSTRPFKSSLLKSSSFDSLTFKVKLSFRKILEIATSLI